MYSLLYLLKPIIWELKHIFWRALLMGCLQTPSVISFVNQPSFAVNMWEISLHVFVLIYITWGRSEICNMFVLKTIFIPVPILRELWNVEINFAHFYEDCIIFTFISVLIVCTISTGESGFIVAYWERCVVTVCEPIRSSWACPLDPASH